MQTFRYLSLSLLLTVLLLSLVPLHATAHAGYDHSDPTTDAVLSVAPQTVHIWFTEELFRRAGMNDIAVYNAEGERVDREDATIDDDDRSLLRVSLADDLPSGRYTVQWHTLSADDGHESNGEFNFTIDNGEEPIPVDAVTPQAQAVPATLLPTVPAAMTRAESPESPASAPLGIPCLSGSAPLLLLLGIIRIRRWQIAHK